MSTSTDPSTGPGTDSDDPVLLAADLLVHHGRPGSGARLIREHSPDRSGHCRGCPHNGLGAPVHPCRLRLIGEAADRIDT